MLNSNHEISFQPEIPFEPLSLGRVSFQSFEKKGSLWLGHMQTILGHILPSPVELGISEEVEIILTEGQGDKAFAHISLPEKVQAPFVLLLFHGLAGDSSSDYMRRLAKVALDRGLVAVRVDHRGANEKGRPFFEPYHSGRSQDISDVIRMVRDRFPDKQIIACGISMSGTILLNLITGKFGSDRPDFAITVNAPLDLADAAATLKRGANQLYDLRFFYKLKSLIEEHDSSVRFPWTGSTELIDEMYTAKKSGFRDRIDYYTRCSPFPDVSKIQIPSLVMTAADDPFVNVEYYKKAQWPKLAQLIIAPSGGHVGYVSRRPIQVHGENFGRRWLDYAIDQFLRKIIASQG